MPAVFALGKHALQEVLLYGTTAPAAIFPSLNIGSSCFYFFAPLCQQFLRAKRHLHHSCSSLKIVFVLRNTGVRTKHNQKANTKAPKIRRLIFHEAKKWQFVKNFSISIEINAARLYNKFINILNFRRRFALPTHQKPRRNI